MRFLLEDSDFNSITTDQIAKTAGVAEGLIYKHFKDKKHLLYQVVKEHFESYYNRINMDLKGIEGSVNKLRKIIWSSIDSYANHRVFARIILLEVRNSPDYFNSEAYSLVKKYNALILDIIQEGINKQDIREDVEPGFIRDMIFGSIEHACLNYALFNQRVSTDHVAENLCRLIITGIEKQIITAK